jgi:hypothetical protein
VLVTMSSGGGAIGTSSASQDLTNYTIKYIEKDVKHELSDPIVSVEKGEAISETAVSSESDENEEATHLLSHEDPFPIDPNEEPELQQFTFRAVFVGCVLGGIIAASKFVLSVLSISHS